MDNLQNFRKISPKTWKKSGNCEKFHFSFHYFIRVLGSPALLVAAFAAVSAAGALLRGARPSMQASEPQSLTLSALERVADRRGDR